MSAEVPVAVVAGRCPTPYRHRLESGRELLFRCNKRRCPSCGQLWAGDTKIRILANLIEGYGGPVDMVTITAPGSEALETYDGQVVEDVAHSWNTSAPGQWSAMWRRLRGKLCRADVRPNLLGYVWAYQRRGVLHVHLAFGARTWAEKRANRQVVQLLKKSGEGGRALEYRTPKQRLIRFIECGWAAEWGFGFVDHQASRGGAKGLASYLAKYVCRDGATGQPELAETVAHDDVPKRPVYTARSCTRRTRVTMRNLRLRRYFWRAETCRQAGALTCEYVEDLHGRMEVVDGQLRPIRGP